MPPAAGTGPEAEGTGLAGEGTGLAGEGTGLAGEDTVPLGEPRTVAHVAAVASTAAGDTAGIVLAPAVEVDSPGDSEDKAVHTAAAAAAAAMAAVRRSYHWARKTCWDVVMREVSMSVIGRDRRWGRRVL